jgi:hypothetical protein
MACHGHRPRAELDAILEYVDAAGLVEQSADKEDQPAVRLAPAGARAARQLGMSTGPGRTR